MHYEFIQILYKAQWCRHKSTKKKSTMASGNEMLMLER